MLKLNLEWKILDEEHVALIFDKPTWLVFQTVADTQGIETTAMIAKALALLLGAVLATRSSN